MSIIGKMQLADQTPIKSSIVCAILTLVATGTTLRPQQASADLIINVAEVGPNVVLSWGGPGQERNL